MFNKAWLFLGLCAILSFSTNTQAGLSDAPGGISDIVEPLLPAVVNISTTKEVQTGGLSLRGFSTPENSPFRHMESFGELFERFFNHKGIRPQMQKATSMGSGFLIDPTGYVVTNNHVIDGASEIIVSVSEEEYEAKVIGHDPKTDLAVLKIESDTPFPYVKFADSDASRVGDWVIVIGNPFGLGGTVTTGIISAKTRDINSGPFDDFIQTDAAINRGNSGGPMFNLEGKVIGINTAIYSPTGNGGNVGIGFAAPSALAQPIIEQLKESGTVERGWLGVKIQNVTDDIAESLGLERTTGVLVSKVMPNAPAKKAGIEAGDIMLSFNGHDVDTIKTLPRLVAETPANSTVPVILFRDGQLQEVLVTIARLEEEAPQNDSSEETVDEQELLLGMQLETINTILRSQYNIPTKINGVAVIGIDPDSDAYERGLKVGDVILEINRIAVLSPKDVNMVLRDVEKQGRSAVLLLVYRNGDTHFVAVKTTDEK